VTTASQSFFLQRDGHVVDEHGATDLRLETSPGYYHLVAKHRNHLAVMSALPVAYTSDVVRYDFASAATHCAGGTNGCVALAPGTWGLAAANADGDGSVTVADREIYSSQAGRDGYLRSDFNLDGLVDTNDLVLWQKNR
jgi:hypothetical protein